MPLIAKSMTLMWPTMLWLLLFVPLLALLYQRLLSRRRRSAARYANLETVWQSENRARADAASGAAGNGAAGGGVPRGGRLRSIAEYLPPLLLLLALTALIFAISRPQAMLMLPSRVDNVILAMDMSGSMKATDIAPNRLVAAQNAAKAFIADQPAQTRVGVVSIAATASVVQSPTEKREDIAAAIERMQPQRGTALGSGMIIALATLLPNAGIDVEKIINPPRQGGSPAPADPNKPKAEPQAPGSQSAAAIVLLSDGQSNVGPDPIKIAQIAADHGVRVFTVGVGTTEGTNVTSEGMTMRVRLDEESLKKIAALTQGEYFRAGNAVDLKKIYQYLSARLTLEKASKTEVTSIFVAIGAGLAMLAAMLSMLWFNRII